jgi:hypothetical protein
MCPPRPAGSEKSVAEMKKSGPLPGAGPGKSALLPLPAVLPAAERMGSRLRTQAES